MEGTRDAGVAGRRPGDAEKQDRARTGERKFVVRLGHGRGIAGAKTGGVALNAVELMLVPPHSHYGPHHRIDLAFVNSPILPKSPQGKAISYTLGNGQHCSDIWKRAFARAIIIWLRTPFAPPVLGRRTGSSLGTRAPDGGVR